MGEWRQQSNGFSGKEGKQKSKTSIGASLAPHFMDNGESNYTDESCRRHLLN